MVRHRSLAVFLVLGAALADCREASKPSGTPEDRAHESPVDVSHPQPESALTTVRLSDSARSHLQIQTVAVENKPVPNRRMYGGEMMIPEGRSIVISAPMSGTIVATDGGPFPEAGVWVEEGDVLLRLTPSIRGRREVLNPSDRIALARARADLEAARVQAAGDVDSAKVRVDGARIALERAEKLFNENAGSRRALDEARGEHRLAQAALDAAKARSKVLDETFSYLSGETEGAALAIKAPFSGVVRRLLVAHDEAIAIGAPLCEIADLNPLWVRVSVYVGDLRSLSTDRPARVRRIGEDCGEGEVLQPVTAPPTANATTSTVDLYYSLDNASRSHQPGERCVVDIPAAGETRSLVFPQAAVVYDIHGDTWVYVAKNDNTFARRRVAIPRITDGYAEVANGLDEGELVVTEGAAELFGTEFGTGGH